MLVDHLWTISAAAEAHPLRHHGVTRTPRSTMLTLARDAKSRCRHVRV